MPHRAYLRRPFDVSDAVRALRSGSTVRSAIHARRVPELRFGARDNPDAIDCGKIGRSVVSSRIISDHATRYKRIGTLRPQNGINRGPRIDF